VAGKPTKVAPFWTADEVAQACQITSTYGANVEKQWPVLFETSAMYDLQDRDVLAGMCGVIGHESAGHWWPIHEFGTDFSRYGYAPSGQDYGGRGLIQTTWQSNYQQVQDYLAINFGLHYDLVNNPDLILNDPTLAAHAALVFWVKRPSLIVYCQRHDWGHVIEQVWGMYAPGNTYFDPYLAQVKRAAEFLLAR
jgi:hypothetical protein